jgi:hypothetical protein
VQDGEATLHSAGAECRLCGCSAGGKACVPQGTTLAAVHDTVTVDELQLNGCASYMDIPCWVTPSGMRELLPFRLMGAKALCTWLSCNGSSESFKNKLRCLVYMDHDKIVHSFIH